MSDIFPEEFTPRKWPPDPEDDKEFLYTFDPWRHTCCINPTYIRVKKDQFDRIMRIAKDNR